MFNPYPSAADLSREAAATARDLGDIGTLRTLHAIVSEALLRISVLDELRHPDPRWSVADLVETLQGEIANITGTERMLRNAPLVLEDED